MKYSDVPKSIALRLLTGLLLLACPLSLAAQNGTSSVQTKIQWLGFEEGLAKAAKENKKILVDIYTDWCHWCEEMDKKVFADDAVAEYINRNFVPVKFSAEANDRVTYRDKTMTQRELSYAMGVTSYPTTLFMKSNGEPITRLGGYVAAETFRDVIEYINVNAYEKMDFETWQKQRIK